VEKRLLQTHIIAQIALAEILLWKSTFMMMTNTFTQNVPNVDMNIQVLSVQTVLRTLQNKFMLDHQVFPPVVLVRY
jgi:hypothetical protein